MPRTRPRRFAYANVTSTLALVVALGGGTAWAVDEWTGENILDGSLYGVDIADEVITAKHIDANSVFTSEIGDETVRSVDIADGSIRTADIHDETITSFDIADRAVRGYHIADNHVLSRHVANGTITRADIDPADRGPAVYARYRDAPVRVHNGDLLIRVPVPTGAYTAIAKATLSGYTSHRGDTGEVSCRLVAGADSDGYSMFTDYRGTTEAAVFTVVHRFTSPGAFNIRCTVDGSQLVAENVKVTAIETSRVENLPYTGPS